ncbi:MAG: sugar kinase, partial [Anaerolineae bacterium]|nr:sugar kinase [Anaerolineae bacterium]
MSERLVSLGEVMLRMSPPRFQRLRTTRSLDVHVAGAQLNVAADFARLGGQGVFVSKLPANELGQLAYDTCLSYGVDMHHVQMIPGARMGINYLEFSLSPRTPVAIFDRQGSAASTIGPDDFEWQAVFSGAQYAHVDGIVPGLSEGCRAATQRYLQTARDLGVTTTFDVNYREHL